MARRNAPTSDPSDHAPWIPLLDYAMKTGISLSTLRRYIKANRVKYKIEDGRYLLWNADSIGNATMHVSASSRLSGSVAESGTSWLAQPSFQRIQNDLQKAREEIAELKTLIALYEERRHEQDA